MSSYSIVQARNQLTRIIRLLEHTPRIEITRRGQSVAVLLSIQEFDRLRQSRTAFWDAYTAFCDATDLTSLNIDPAVFEGLRDASPGREMAE